MTLAFAQIEAAAERLKGHIERTPCRHSKTLSQITGAEVWVKFENQQFTAAFKELEGWKPSEPAAPRPRAPRPMP